MLRRARRLSTDAYSAGLLKLLFTSARLAESIESMPLNIHLPWAAAIKSTSSSSRRRVELVKVAATLGARREGCQARPAILTGLVIGGVNLVEFAPRGLLGERGPGLSALAERDGVGVALAPVASARPVRHLRHVRAAHD